MWQDQYRLLIFDEIDSTNQEALRLAKNGICQDLVIFAKNQTDGYGRSKRPWQSGEGNLAMSILLKSDDFSKVQSQLSFVVGLSLYDVIGRILSTQNIVAEVMLKWPNDLMINEAKIAGILLESIKYNNIKYLVIGIGVNLCSAPKIENRQTTSLNNLGLKVISARELLDLIMNSFIYYNDLWRKQGFGVIRKLWLEKTFKTGDLVTFTDGSIKIVGHFLDIDSEGAVRMKLSSGEIYSKTSGEVFFGEIDV